MKSNKNITLRSIPLIRLVIPFAAGIYLGSLLSGHDIKRLMVVIPLLCLISYMMHIRKSQLWFGLTALITIALLGIIRIDQIQEQTNRQVPPILQSIPATYKATLQDDLYTQPDKQWISTHLNIDSIYLNDQWHPRSFPVQAIIQRQDTFSQIAYGTEISFQGEIDTIAANRNPFAFDYKQFLFRKGITHQVFIAQDQWKITKHDGESLYASANRLQTRLSHTLAAYIQQADNQGIAIAMILGNKDYIPSELYEAYRKTGSAHIIAVSGLHVGIIAFIIMAMLKPMTTRSKWAKLLKAGGIISILTSYAFVTGLSISVVRATVMYASVILIYLLSHQKNIWNTLAGVAFLILIIQPQQLFQIGFQFSFLAITGILLFNPLLSQYIHSENRIIKYILSLFTVSISAQALLWPLIIYYFNLFSFGFLLTNLLIIPAAFLIILIGLLLLAVDFVAPTLGPPLASLLDGILTVTNGFVNYVQQLSPMTYDRIWMSTSVLLLCYLMMTALFKLLHRYSKLQVFSLLVTANLIFILIAAQVYQINHRASVVVYEHPREFIFDLIHDRTCYSFMSNSNTKTAFIAESNRIKHGVRDVIKLDIDTDYQDHQVLKTGSLIQFHGFVIDINALADPRHKTPKQVSINHHTGDQIDRWIVNHQSESFKVDQGVNHHSLTQSGPKIFTTDL